MISEGGSEPGGLGDEHLSLCMRMFVQQFYTLQGFRYTEAVRKWMPGAVRRMVSA